MPTLTVITADGVREVPYSPASSVRAALEAADVPVRWGCRGDGACGLCTVGIRGGTVSAPTQNELLLLSAEQIDAGVRLACQLTPAEDLRIEVLGAFANPALNPVFVLQGRADGHGALASAGAGTLGYGAAIDVGTTNVRVSLCDIESGERIAGCVVGNPQSASGADVMTRLIAAGESAGLAKRAAQLLTDIIRDAMRVTCASVDVDPGRIVSVRAVGNTPMLLLMTMNDPAVLLDPQSWTRPIDCRVQDRAEWRRALGVAPDASIEVIQPLAGFVGSDLLAAVLATDLVGGPKGLLIDFGTNSEIALWDGEKLRVTSAAGGPAFESVGLTCGMPAESGAIHGMKRAVGSGELHCDVIGGGAALGLCGSGFVDLIALLLDGGELSVAGRLEAGGGDAFVLTVGDERVRVTNRDVDTFQRAKAAVGAGVDALLHMADISQDELERVCVCGSFGRHLDPTNGKRIGLLPDVADECFELHDAAAVSGCELLLASESNAARLDAIRQDALMLNLAQSPDFDALFLENLYLRPQGATSA